MRQGTVDRLFAGVKGLEIWIGALGCFALAGATGALFRYGMLAELPPGLSLGNLRYAHSHLMYFGWVTPALMAMIVVYRFGARIPSSMIWIPRMTLLLGRGKGNEVQEPIPNPWKHNRGGGHDQSQAGL